MGGRIERQLREASQTIGGRHDERLSPRPQQLAVDVVVVRAGLRWMPKLKAGGFPIRLALKLVPTQLFSESTQRPRDDSHNFHSHSHLTLNLT